MTSSSPPNSQQPILWFQVGGLALVQGAIALLWLIYNLYLPKLLSQFGFPENLSIGLLVVENLLAIVMEPLMGGLSDRAQRWLGSRFPFIAVGVVLAATLFVAIPAIVIFGSPVGVLRWVLPAALVAWALAMTIFRSPALSLLGRYAFESSLPQAASILTLMGALVGAVNLAASQFILSLGPAIAFALGSFVLLLAAAVLRGVDSPLATPPANDGAWSSNASARAPVSLQKLGLVFGAGAGIVLGFMLMRSLLRPAIPQPGQGMLLATFTFAHLLTVIPAGLVAGKLGNRLAMISGLGGMVGLMGLVGLLPAVLSPGIVVLLGTAFSLVANGTLPFALAQVPPTKAGLGTGILFGGGALASSVFGTFLAQPGSLSPAMLALVGSGAFLLGTVCVAIAYTRQVSPQRI